MFAVDFAYAGLEYPASESGLPAIFFGVGTRAEDGTVTGSRTFVTADGTVTPGPTDLATMTFLSGGRMAITDAAGLYTQSNFGTDFRMSAGYPMGSFSALPQATTGGSGKQTRFFIEQRPVNVDWYNFYRFSVTRISASGEMTSLSASITFEFQHPLDFPWPDSPPLAANITFGSAASVRRLVVSTTDDGVLTLDSGEVLYFTNNSNPYEGEDSYGLWINNTATEFLYVDPSAADGSIGIGVGGMDLTSAERGAVGGVYSGAMVVSGPMSAEFFGAATDQSGYLSSDVVLVLSEGKAFSLYRAADYFSANQVVLRSGAWSATTTSLVLEDTFIGLRAEFQTTPSRAIVGARVQAIETGVHEAVTGLLSFYVGTFEEKYGEAREVFLGEGGHAHVYTWIEDHRDNSSQTDVWATFDLNQRAGGEPLVTARIIPHPIVSVRGNTAAYEDMVYGIDVRGHAVIYERTYGGDWRYRDLTEELDAAEFASDRIVFEAWKFDATYTQLDATVSYAQRHQVPVLFGKDVNGRHVLFRPTDDYSTPNQSTMPFVRYDLTQALVDGAQASPDFSGGWLTGFTSPWGSINIVGLDAGGGVEALWTSPGYGWYVNNLSDAAQAPALAGGLTAYWTTWHALTVAGLDDAGHVSAVWWTPATGQWLFNDLTADYSLPALAHAPGNRLINVVNHDYSALAIGGFDDAGQVHLYWWAVGQPGWTDDVITEAVPAVDLPTRLSHGDVHGLSSFFSTEQSVWGFDDDNHVVRLRWRDRSPDAWTFEDVTEVSLDQD